ncbi:MAG: hypothetical protein JWM83_3059 [Candidatus Angelobacter sp.]|nr:hypothetical protein [Candidatus Angelobacter sp.]
MSGSFDKAARSKQQSPPGGKALIRLVQLLEAKGQTDLATAAIHSAVPSALQKSFLTRAGKPASPMVHEAMKDVTAESVALRQERATRAYLAAARQMGPVSDGGPQWRSLGPATVSNGQTADLERMNVSGRVAAVAVDPSDSSHVLCGSANGGIWESHDRGGSWVPRTDDFDNLSVGAIAFDPGDPSVVYCGTGEGNFWAITGIGSIGILHSTDGGASWEILCTDPFIGQGFFDLAVDPSDSMHLIAATTDGLYVSQNAGVNWSMAHPARTWSISTAPRGSRAEILAASADGLWNWNSKRKLWAPVALPGAPDFFDSSKPLAGRLAVSIATSHPAVAYAWGARSGESPFLWRRAHGVWTAVSSLYPETKPAADGSYPETSQAWYDWHVAAAPDSDTEVYCGAVHSYRGNFSGSDWSWTPLNVHTDHHAIAFEPGNPNMIYVGSDGGLFRSPDRGVTWHHCNNGLVISQFEYIAQDIKSAQWLIGGTQDNGVVRWNDSPDWEHVADGDGGYCCVNPNNPQVVLRTDHGWRVERSVTGGDYNSFTSIYPVQAPDEDTLQKILNENVLFYPPMRFNEITGNTVAIGGGVVYVSRENGSNWVSLPFPPAALPQTASPQTAMASAIYLPNSDSIYVGTTMGEIFVTTWDGSAWTPLAGLVAPPLRAPISDLLIDSNDLDRIWAIYSWLHGGRVYRSYDGGKTWIDCSTGLPNLQLNAIEVDSRDPNRVWVCAERGVYQSRDGGANWTNFSKGLPNAYIGDLLFHPVAFLLRAATSNRGVWEIAVDG